MSISSERLNSEDFQGDPKLIIDYIKGARMDDLAHAQETGVIYLQFDGRGLSVDAIETVFKDQYGGFAERDQSDSDTESLAA